MSDYFLADDLSGALDAAAAFHHAGRRVRVVLAAGTWSDGEIVGFTTETRNAAAAIAAQTVTTVVKKAEAQGSRLLYKKIDSTLRGPVAAELEALRQALPQTRVLFAPANPAVGRTVRDGVLWVKGVPVAETEFGRDPVSPVRESSIRNLLGSAADERVTIPDVITEADLEDAVRQMNSTGGSWVAVGSGALARPVAALHRRTTNPSPPFPWPKVSRDGILMLGGSAHPVNRRQAERHAMEARTSVFELQAHDIESATKAAIAAVNTIRCASLLLHPTRIESQVALRALVESARQIITETGLQRIFVTGGETAFALCQALGISSLCFLQEVEPGLSVSYAEIEGRPLLIAVKPGGFGDEQTWVRAWTALGGRR